MNKKLFLIKQIVFVINVIIFLFITLVGRNQYLYNMSYTKCILFMIMISSFLYVCGIVINDDKTYKNNIIEYITLFILLLIGVTFFIGRTEIKFYNWWYVGQYNPFYTIIYQFKYGSSISILKNIFGNGIMLIPLSFLLMIKNKKYKNIFKQTLIILPIIICIELLQAFTHTGIFDIDDIILNYFGTIIFTFLITRFGIIDKIRKLFFTNFKLKNKIKNRFFLICLLVILIFDVLLFI